MTRYLIAEGDSIYVIQADTSTEALQIVSDWEGEEA